jgi:hypothetical protein
MNPTRSERGAVATIIAILFSLGVVFGVMALAVDAGGLFLERRELQNGSDAAAMSLAEACALGECVPGGQGDLEDLVDANAVDGDHGIESQCALNATSTTLPACVTGNFAEATACPPLPPSYVAGVPYVEVGTSTRSNGESSLVNIFSRAAGNDAESTVVTCSRAGWGKPGAAAGSTPITISACEWQTYTNSGASWVVDGPTGAWPGYGGTGQEPWPPAATRPNTPGHELIITLHDPSKPPCSFNGKDTAGGFGYLDTSGSCSTTVSTVNGVDKWASIDTGSSATNPCKAAMANLWANGPTIDIPVFDCIVKSTSGVPAGSIAGRDCSGASPAAGGATSYYHIAGWANFYLSGYKLGGSPDTERASRVSGLVPCSGAVRCISGWFVKGTLSDTTTVVPPTSGGTDFGTYGVVPLG